MERYSFLSTNSCSQSVLYFQVLVVRSCSIKTICMTIFLAGNIFAISFFADWWTLNLSGWRRCFQVIESTFDSGITWCTEVNQPRSNAPESLHQFYLCCCKCWNEIPMRFRQLHWYRTSLFALGMQISYYSSLLSVCLLIYDVIYFCCAITYSWSQ